MTVAGTTGLARSATGSRWRRMAPPAMVAGSLALASVALHLRDPHVQGSWGECPTLALFGVVCPGCGGLRAVNDLTHLQVVDAASSNLLFVATLPLIAYFFVRWSVARWTGRSWNLSERVMARSALTFVVVMVVFTVVRNVPAGAWLAP